MSLETRAEPTITEVVSGIVADSQKLIAQQGDLLRSEIAQNWQKAKRAMQPVAVGALLGGTGIVLLGISAALLLHWAVSPEGVDPARIPLWGCFGLAAIAFLVLAAALVTIGIKQMEEVPAIPKATAEELEKNIAAVISPRERAAPTPTL